MEYKHLKSILVYLSWGRYSAKLTSRDKPKHSLCCMKFQMPFSWVLKATIYIWLGKRGRMLIVTKWISLIRDHSVLFLQHLFSWEAWSGDQRIVQRNSGRLPGGGQVSLSQIWSIGRGKLERVCGKAQRRMQQSHRWGAVCIDGVERS